VRLKLGVGGRGEILLVSDNLAKGDPHLRKGGGGVYRAAKRQYRVGVEHRWPLKERGRRSETAPLSRDRVTSRSNWKKRRELTLEDLGEGGATTSFDLERGG